MRSPPYFNPRAPCGARPACRTGQSTTADFNPRAPCGARRLLIEREDVLDEFQSTRPMRGATAMYVDIHAPRRKFQSTRPMRGATPLPPQPKTAKMRFQSTRPMRGATTCKVLQAFAWDISIHAPHAGRDIRAINHVVYKFDFNPRAPCGARLLAVLAPRHAL